MYTTDAASFLNSINSIKQLFDHKMWTWILSVFFTLKGQSF